jgi:hypothetical protein
VGADAVVLSVEDRPQQQRALEVAEGAHGLLELLEPSATSSAERLRVAGGEQVLAIEPLLGCDLRPVEDEPAALGLAEIAGEGRVVAQRALAAQVRVPLGLDPLEPLLAAGPVALGLGRVVADDVCLQDPEPPGRRNRSNQADSTRPNARIALLRAELGKLRREVCELQSQRLRVRLDECQ